MFTNKTQINKIEIILTIFIPVAVTVLQKYGTSASGNPVTSACTNLTGIPLRRLKPLLAQCVCVGTDWNYAKLLTFKSQTND